MIKRGVINFFKGFKYYLTLMARSPSSSPLGYSSSSWDASIASRQCLASLPHLAIITFIVFEINAESHVKGRVESPKKAEVEPAKK